VIPNYTHPNNKIFVVSRVENACSRTKKPHTHTHTLSLSLSLEQNEVKKVKSFLVGLFPAQSRSLVQGGIDTGFEKGVQSSSLGFTTVRIV